MLKTPINRENFEIETERLKPEPITIQYADDIFSEFTEEITQYMVPKPAKEVSETKDFIIGAIERNHKQENIQLVILDKRTKECLWCIGLHTPNTPTPEFWIRTKKSAHGNKYGQEAIQWLYKRAQENILCNYVIYPVDQKSIPSRKIAESIGWKTDWVMTIKDTFDPNKKLESVTYKVEL